MSQLTIAGNASGTGIFTVAAPNSNTNRTLTLPNATGTVALTTNIPGEISAANIQNATSSTTGLITGRRVRSALNASGSAPIFASRAWVNFNGTNGSMRGSGNVSGVTRLGTGSYRVNFAAAMPDANYSAVISTNQASGTDRPNVALTQGAYITTSLSFIVVQSSERALGTRDSSIINVSIFR